MLNRITRQDIEREGRIVHRAVVYFFNGKRDIIVAVREGLNPVEVYRAARREGNVKGRCAVEWLPAYSEDMQAGIH